MAEEKVRLQKFMSECGVASRRKSEELIESGKVRVNGAVASLGDKINPKKDTVTVSGKKIVKQKEHKYIMLHKPRGFITTMSDEMERKCVAQLISDVPQRVYPVGRLDKDSEGLLLMTNRGDLANDIIHAGNFHEKEYLVTVDQPFNAAFLKKMREGVELKELGVTTRPCRVEAVGPKAFRIILTQGLNRQIRRMCGELGYRVLTLKRIRIMNILLGRLNTGDFRRATAKELEELMWQLERARMESGREEETGNGEE